MQFSLAVNGYTVDARLLFRFSDSYLDFGTDDD